MRTITALTVVYVLLVGALMFHVNEAGSKFGGVVFGEMIFASPMLLAWSVAASLKRDKSRHVMLIFTIVYAFFSAAMYNKITTGDHDAQWQLGFLLIPMAGIFGIVMAVVIAGVLERLDMFR